MPTTALYVHVMFSTKDRTPSIDAAWQMQLYEQIAQIMTEFKGDLLVAGGGTDHVHLVMKYSEDWSVADLVKKIKAGSQKWIRQNHTEQKGFTWQKEFVAFSASTDNLPNVQQYLTEQSNIHQTMPYQEEVRVLFNKHRLEIDESTIWD
ncbi:MAG: IS200/IS605 family transposase [Gemmataceae bacterium]